jgi:hypothetical protein
MKKALLTVILLVTHFCISQQYYLVSIVDFPIENTLHQMDLSHCDNIASVTCLPTNNPEQAPEQQYTDVAVDAAGNIFYISGAGSLYKQTPSGSCTFLTTFDHVINALTTDAVHKIYAAGTQNGIAKLFVYDLDIGQVTVPGNLPDGFFPLGDLFFYKNSLLMTATNSDFTESSLVEINMVSPTESCVVMSLGNMQPYGGFSIFDGVQTHAFITTAENNVYALREIDPVNQTIGPILCTYGFAVMGAASYYAQSSVTSECLLGVGSVQEAFIHIANPAHDSLLIETNIDGIALCCLYDISGRKVKSFGNGDRDISGMANGIYFIELINAYGQSIIRKIIVE